MRKTSFILVESLIVDRFPINESVLELVFFIMQGGEVPAIHVQKVNDGWKVMDGRHRACAYKLLGKTEILAKYAA